MVGKFVVCVSVWLWRGRLFKDARRMGEEKWNEKFEAEWLLSIILGASCNN